MTFIELEALHEIHIHPYPRTEPIKVLTGVKMPPLVNEQPDDSFRGYIDAYGFAITNREQERALLRLARLEDPRYADKEEPS